MAALNTGQWIKFFLQAGIPDKAAATYALTFAENRIQMNMLLDLNKEYLRDMGITLMGDVIAILKHARTKHEELAREKLLVPIDTEKNAGTYKAVEIISVSGNTPKPSAVPAKKSSSASQEVDHYIHDGPIASTITKPKPKVQSKEPDVIIEGTHVRKVSVTQSAVANSVKRKMKSTLDEVVNGEEVSPKKPRRVSPEEEGGYKIKMPSGSTPRSQQILAKSKEIARRKTVFQRLGSNANPSTSGTTSPPSASAVSSTTGTSTPSFKITGIDTHIVSDKVVKKDETAVFPQRSQLSSVFRRLGDKQVSSSTTQVTRREDALPYAGILKPPGKIVKRIVRPKNLEAITMVADSVDTGRTEVRDRLGSVVKNRISDFSYKAESKKGIPDSSVVGVKWRLGGTKMLASDKIERESSVKERLNLPLSKSNPRITQTKTSGFSAGVQSALSKRGVFSRLGM